MQRYVGLTVAVLLAAAAFGSGIQFGQGVNGNGQLASIFSLFAAEPEPAVSAEDLGEFWESLIHAPIPLGGIVVKRNVDTKLQRTIDALIKQSVEFAFLNSSKIFVLEIK